jgi:hypothetical protein
MTEREYINLTDLQRVRDAKGILRQMNNESNPCVHPKEWSEVMAKLSEWETLMSKKVKTK